MTNKKEEKEEAKAVGSLDVVVSQETIDIEIRQERIGNN